MDRTNARIDQLSPWGEFVRAWGWGVADGKTEFETCTVACRAGVEGSGAGQFNEPEAVAVNGKGDVYVIEAGNHRVQEFDAQGNIVTSFGSYGTGPGQLGGGFAAYLSKIAVSPTTEDVFVGEGERVQVFEAGGAFKEEIAMPAGMKVKAVAVGPSGDLYVAFEGSAAVREIEPQGPSASFLAPTFEEEPEPPFVAAPLWALAVDQSGDLYEVVMPVTSEHKEEPWKVLEFEPSGKCVDCRSNGEGGKPGFDRSAGSEERGVAVGGACGSSDVYVAHFDPGHESFFSVWGEAPVVGVCPQPVRAPEVRVQYAAGVETSAVSLRASVNPRFWPDTTYRVEYGSSPCRLGGCVGTVPVRLTSRTVAAVLETEPVRLEGLLPGVTYHYRFVAESGGGGPVYGVAPEGGVASMGEGLEGVFTTYREPGPVESCPANEVFRTGPSALLPDCRAFEMVSPVEKANGDISVLTANYHLPLVLEQSSSDGERLAYGSARAFGDAVAAPFTSEYVATRHAGEGWVSQAVSPPRTKEITAIVEQTSLLPEFEAFSPDLCEAWVHSVAEPPLAEGAPAGFEDLYKRSDGECGGAGYEALNTATPSEPPYPLLEGVSGDGTAAVFAARGRLAAGGSTGPQQLYYASGGTERFVCFLPNGSAFAGECTAGFRLQETGGGVFAMSATAMSSDGSLVYWSERSSAQTSSHDALYLRENPGQAQSAVSGGVCTQPAKGCTLAVSGAVEAASGVSGSEFWVASTDGSKALFTNDGQLYEYRLEDRSARRIAGKVLGVMGASEDLSRVYLVSEEALGGSNGEGRTAVGGEMNLYFWEEAAGFHFVGALDREDVGGGYVPSPFDAVPEYRDSRVSGDGEHVVFESYASLTGYDNTDINSGQADSEVFLYDATANGGQGGLVCVSCNPSGARPSGQQYDVHEQDGPWTAGRIPGWETNLYAQRVMSTNGRRVFFESFDSLVPTDTNGQLDVYEWEAAGEGGCGEVSSSYSPQDGGCVSLISTGKSPSPSLFVDASPSGDDVFFATGESLVPQDYGLVDIYDARVGGGLPGPPVERASCEGEACQAPVLSAPSPSVGSLTLEGAGNVLVSPLPAATKAKSKKLTSAQRLAVALAKCRHVKNKHKRAMCEQLARKRYPARQAAGVKRHQAPGRRR